MGRSWPWLDKRGCNLHLRPKNFNAITDYAAVAGKSRLFCNWVRSCLLLLKVLDVWGGVNYSWLWKLDHIIYFRHFDRQSLIYYPSLWSVNLAYCGQQLMNYASNKFIKHNNAIATFRISRSTLFHKLNFPWDVLIL